MNHHPDEAIVREVGLRDSPQVLARNAPTAHKIDGPRGVCAAGLRHCEVGSLLASRRTPRMADTPEVVAAGLHGVIVRAELPETPQPAAVLA